MHQAPPWPFMPQVAAEHVDASTGVTESILSLNAQRSHDGRRRSVPSSSSSNLVRWCRAQGFGLATHEELILEVLFDEAKPMSKEEMVDAVEKRTFASYTVQQIYEGLEELVDKELLRKRRFFSDTHGKQAQEDSLVLYYPGGEIVNRHECKPFIPVDEYAVLIANQTVHMLREKREGEIIDKWETNLRTASRGVTSTSNSTRKPAREQLALTQELNRQKVEALHQLNEAKDHTLKLLGIVAELSQCTVSDVYKELGLKE